MKIMSSVQGDIMEPTETTQAETVIPVQTSEVDVKALQEQLEAIKKSQSGSDKAYQEQVKAKLALEVELEKLKKEKMTEKEKADYEIAQSKAMLEKQKQEVAEATLGTSCFCFSSIAARSGRSNVGLFDYENNQRKRRTRRPCGICQRVNRG